MTKVLMDCDPGWDDCLALLLLLGKGTGNSVGVTTTWGNADIKTTTMNARLMTGYCDKSGTLYVYKGLGEPLGPRGPASVAKPINLNKLIAHPSPGYLGATNAPEEIRERARSYAQDLTVLATGPLTNIATAIKLDPNAMKSVSSVVIVGGAFADKNTDEFNLSADQAATQIVLKAASSGMKTVLIPFETLERMNDPQLSLDIQGMKTDHAEFYASVIKDQEAQGNAEAGKGLYDQLGALYVLKPELFQTEERNIGIVFSPSSMGQIVRNPGGSLVTLVMDLDVKGVKNLLLERLS